MCTCVHTYVDVHTYVHVLNLEYAGCMVCKLIHMHCNIHPLTTQIARTSLLQSCCNKKMPLPLKLCEISDVVLQDAKKGK